MLNQLKCFVSYCFVFLCLHVCFSHKNLCQTYNIDPESGLQFFEIWRGDLKSMAKSDHHDQGCPHFKWNVSAHVLLVFRPLASGL